MKNTIRLFEAMPRIAIIALVAVIGFSTTGCPTEDDGGTPGGTEINAPDIGQLPDFPAGSTPAATKADAEAVLKELRQSTVLESLNREMSEVVRENRPDSNNENYSFSNRSLPDGYVKVSASATENETSTGGYKALDDNRKAIDDLRNILNDLYEDYSGNQAEISRLQDERDRLYAEQDTIQFALNDKSSGTYAYNEKGEVTKAKTESGVTIAQGSIIEMQYSGSENETVTTAGTFETFRYSGTGNYKGQEVRAFTVTSSSGSVKVIFDVSGEQTYSANNVPYYNSRDDDGVTETETYSGSLRVYGADNALLIDHRIVDAASYDFADYLISYDEYPFDPDSANSATPLTNNTPANGTIASSDTVWFSINVTSGTKYYLWCDSDIDLNNRMYNKYNGEGYPFRPSSGGGSSGGGSYSFDCSFTATTSGTVYIMVYPSYGSGNYTIVYNTTGSQPSMGGRSASSVAPVAPFNRRGVTGINCDTKARERSLL